MNSLKYILPITFTILLMGCSGSKDGDGTGPPTPVPSPLAATLIFPNNNETCNEGITVSETESTVTFKWSSAEFTDTYLVNLINLDTNTSQSITAETNEKSITILRGTPYKWNVISKAKGTDATAQSDDWKFYNAGIQVESHAPFPAEAVAPKMGSSVNSGQINIKWNANDVDNDISSYEVYLDSFNPPTTLLTTQTSNSVNLDVASGQVYYWQVITKDSVGNTSISQIFEFKVN